MALRAAIRLCRCHALAVSNQSAKAHTMCQQWLAGWLIGLTRRTRQGVDHCDGR